ncbi:hypothetical protein SLEP1_g21312 [Rubroshorea leprosula]|uniref:Uncharacterized protein n=1 Tax=Rubroshorea leprosula TaxID=152421 RepID=A0AAV5JES4_9ROSI|nr:hypothetical protein SLEP1_g21312 [Rubroshorea leprosula]
MIYIDSDFQNFNPRFKLGKAEEHNQTSSIYSNKNSLCFVSLEKIIVSVEVDKDKVGHGDDDDDDDDSEFDMLLKSDQ